MKPQWRDPMPVAVPDDLRAWVDDALLAGLLVRRGIHDIAAARRFLDPAQYTPAPPDDLPDMDRAVARLERAIADEERLCVWGDFDVDGQTATALLVEALRELGAKVRYVIPHRQREGHGVHVPRLMPLVEDGVTLVLTCDTGIAAHEAVNFANTQGVDVIITDHHQLPETLPNAHAAVNPQRLPVDHPLRTLPGVGVAYKLVEALFARAGRDDVARFLDLVALGIVADVAEQVGDTRYLLQRGLAVLRQTPRLGLLAMLERANIKAENVDAEDIGFALGPRLNALGRLDDAQDAVELLTTTDLERARILANRLEGLNNDRRDMVRQVHEGALAQIDRQPELLNAAVLVLGHESWPGGIVGIVATRLVEQYNRPVILFNTEGRVARGSARSVAGLDITAAIAEHSHLLERYGGHTMAAGLSLPAEQIPVLRRELSATVKAMRTDIEETPTLDIDAYLPLDDLTLDLVHSLDRAAPFGPGNPAPVFASQKLTLKSYRQLGRTGEHVRLTVGDESGAERDIVWWRADLESLPPGRFDVAYGLRINDWKDTRELQITLVDIRPVNEEPQTFVQRSGVEVIDYRVGVNQREAAARLADSGVVIWGEGGAAVAGLTLTPRHELARAEALAIWTIPPGPQVLAAALHRVNPARVYLFAVDPQADEADALLAHSMGLVKYALNAYSGAISLERLAAATTQRPQTMHKVVQWLAAQGHITITGEEGDTLHVRAGGTASTEAAAHLREDIAALLAETAAYRAHFRRADKDALVVV